MRFIHTGAQTLLAFTTILSGVASAPVADGTLTADDAASKTLSERDVYIATGGTHSVFEVINQLNTKLHSPWLSDALPALSGRYIDSGRNLAKRARPTTQADFQRFFASEPQKSKMNSMVFWSGMGHGAARAFATSTDCNILEILMGNNWKQFQDPSGGYWDAWDAATLGFWDLASEACAEFSRGEVCVYMLPQSDVDQQQNDPSRSNCGTCWYRKKKPALIAGLGSKVTHITKFLTTSQSQSAGQITNMGDKIELSDHFETCIGSDAAKGELRQSSRAMWNQEFAV